MLAQQELKKQEDKAALDAKIKARANRARGRRARGGRGGAFPDRIIRGGTGIGAFSSERGLGMFYIVRWVKYELIIWP